MPYNGCGCPICTGESQNVPPPPDCDGICWRCDANAETQKIPTLCPVAGVHEIASMLIQGKQYCKHCGAWKADW